LLTFQPPISIGRITIDFPGRAKSEQTGSFSCPEGKECTVIRQYHQQVKDFKKPNGSAPKSQCTGTLAGNLEPENLPIRMELNSMNFHFLWRLLYNNSARMYDLTSFLVSLGKWQAWCRTSISFLKHRRVLELAHGPGHLLITLKEAGRQPVGVDLSARMTKRARRRLSNARIDVPLVRCRAQELPFRSGSFDEVVATFPTDYIFDPLTIDEVARVTSGKGRLVVVAGAQQRGLQPDNHFVDWLRRMTEQGASKKKREPSAFTRAGLTTRIEHKRVGDGMVTLFIAEKGGKDGRSRPVLIPEHHPVQTEANGVKVLKPLPVHQ
jgi:ubiquinone/menaquinone biosynthesis C-methylase UbiE